MAGMRRPRVVFTHTGLTVHAAPQGEHWRGELLDGQGQLKDVFAYTRDAFPGAIIGALRVRDVAFAPQLAYRMWLYTEPAPSGEPIAASDATLQS
jgi:hypothetical protein